MDAVYPEAASLLMRSRRGGVRTRNKRALRDEQRARYRTQPVTFAEIKEVDEETEEAPGQAEECRRRGRVDRLDDDLVRKFEEFRRRRARTRSDRIAEHEEPPPASPATPGRAASEPSRLRQSLSDAGTGTLDAAGT